MGENEGYPEEVFTGDKGVLGTPPGNQGQHPAATG
jgi:hypothetical protein